MRHLFSGSKFGVHSNIFLQAGVKILFLDHSTCPVPDFPPKRAVAVGRLAPEVGELGEVGRVLHRAVALSWRTISRRTDNAFTGYRLLDQARGVFNGLGSSCASRATIMCE